MKRKEHLSKLGTGLFTFISIFYVLPIVVVLFNSFKKKSYINLEPFKLPNSTTFVGMENYTTAIDQYGFLKAVGWTVFITVGSVLAILICTSMCAWFITRVQNCFTKGIYLLCVFSMVVPFQMVMFTPSLVTDRLGLGTPWGLIIVYLGFGAGWRYSCSAALLNLSRLGSRKQRSLTAAPRSECFSPWCCPS